uniref:Uncharacterized protein n=1 Tax=Micrurus corallinus TaxID=54390 RepID=A0A2D4FT34_MICCO
MNEWTTLFPLLVSVYNTARMTFFSKNMAGAKRLKCKSFASSLMRFARIGGAGMSKQDRSQKNETSITSNLKLNMQNTGMYCFHIVYKLLFIYASLARFGKETAGMCWETKERDRNLVRFTHHLRGLPLLANSHLGWLR